MFFRSITLSLSLYLQYIINDKKKKNHLLKKLKKKKSQKLKGEDRGADAIELQHLTPAPCDGTAPASVGIHRSAGAAVIVGLTTLGAGHTVPLQRAVADVALGG